jgi:hypothetical protein
MWKKTVLALGLAAAVSACGDEGLTAPDPDAGADVGFSEPITLSELQSASSSPVRVEVELYPDATPLLARELEVEDSEELVDEEKLEGRVTALRRGATGAVLVLDLGGLEVDVGAGTRFRDETGAGDLSMAAALDRLEAELAAGGRPPVEAKRTPPTQPQAPDDPSFVASKLRLNDESSDPRLELNVDTDNFDLGGTGGQGTLRVLGLEIGLDVTGGRTELEREGESAAGEVDFEGLVATADAASGTVTLVGGLVIRIVDGTEVEQGSGEKHLRSLTAVAEALAGGHTVEAEGEGVQETPGVLVATKVEFEVEDKVEDMPGADEFEGRVTAADPAARTFTLAGGRVLTLGDGSTFDPEGDLHSLQAMADAVASGAAVRAEGHAVSTGAASALVVGTVKVEIDD